VAAAIGFAHLAARMSRRSAAALAALAITCAALDGWMKGLPVEPLPDRLAALDASAERSPVLELPPSNVLSETAAMYRSMYHRRPLEGGYSGFYPPSYQLLRIALNDVDPEAIDAVAALGRATLVVDERSDAGRLWTAVLAKRPGTVDAGVEAGRRIFELPPMPAPAAMTGEALPIAAYATSAAPASAGLVSDGNVRTRWTTGPGQRGDETFTIDLGSARSIAGLTLFLGPFIGDYPRVLAVDGSSDGAAWTTAWTGRTLVAAAQGALRDPRGVPIAIPVRFDGWRFVRLRQIGAEREFPWSIAELRVRGR
jgi:hypothetical protein